MAMNHFTILPTHCDLDFDLEVFRVVIRPIYMCMVPHIELDDEQPNLTYRVCDFLVLIYTCCLRWINLVSPCLYVHPLHNAQYLGWVFIHFAKVAQHNWRIILPQFSALGDWTTLVLNKLYARLRPPLWCKQLWRRVWYQERICMTYAKDNWLKIVNTS